MKVTELWHIGWDGESEHCVSSLCEHRGEACVYNKSPESEIHEIHAESVHTPPPAHTAEYILLMCACKVSSGVHVSLTCVSEKVYCVRSAIFYSYFWSQCKKHVLRSESGVSTRSRSHFLIKLLHIVDSKAKYSTNDFKRVWTL